MLVGKNITVIIPTYNASKHLPNLLERLAKQTVKNCELIIIDSLSQDDTVEKAKSYNARIIVIPRSEFSHGGTRTLAAKESKGDILVYLTQDVLPFDERAIENIVKPLTCDLKIGASFGRQISYSDASVFAEHLRLFNYPDTPHVRTLEDRKKYGIRTAFLSNSFAAYRRSMLKEVGYFKSGLIFGEDTCVAAEMLLRGYKIAYAADAKVFHSHNYTVRQDFKRYFDMGVFHEKEKWLLQKFGNTECHAARYVKSEIEFLYSKKRFDLFPHLAARIIMKYIGYALGRKYGFLPVNLCKKFSMNCVWWDRSQIPQ